jgi:hypothetical protein
MQTRFEKKAENIVSFESLNKRECFIYASEITEGLDCVHSGVSIKAKLNTPITLNTG